MTSIWVESLVRSYDQALELLAAAVRDCTDELWEKSMWEVPPVPALSDKNHFTDANWNAITDPAEHRELSQRWVDRYSTPWSVAWHALECLDYYLSDDSAPWSAPPPFNPHPHWRDLATLPAAWSPTELLGYTDYCREAVRQTLADMTDEKASTPVSHHPEQPHAWIITGMVGHTTEHASQIRQFITAAGVAPPT